MEVRPPYMEVSTIKVKSPEKKKKQKSDDKEASGTEAKEAAAR